MPDVLPIDRRHMNDDMMQDGVEETPAAPTEEAPEGTEGAA